jgi:bacterioferritin-associated ferredoxin
MIVCSCTLITSKDIAEAVASLRTNDPFVVLTPGLIYRHLGKRPSCGNCLPLITKLMVAYDEDGPSSAALVPTTGHSRSPSPRDENGYDGHEG